ncbi:MAG: Fe(3+) ABC transporter substrate-binding protein [Hyphomicrobiales bacterium]|nr:Fe(3+) ABC transporter substrate-binding protein [Hyphomicrobiales bacterium]
MSAIVVAAPAFAQENGEVTVYSYRQPFLIKPLLDAFTEETGIETNFLFAGKGLLERVDLEGRNSPADVILTVDIGRLAQAVNQGITQPVASAVLEENIPAIYRDPRGHWFGLTRRARVAYASKDRVDRNGISYEDLADPEWKGRICIRDGQHAYNVALFAAFLEHHGRAKTQEWLEGVRDNLARSPVGNDREQVKAVFAGECDIAIGNTYYLGVMQTNDQEPEQKQWADSVRILFPAFENGGTHVNLSGMVMAKHAPNRGNAQKLMEFLSSETAQQLYAQINFEYPVGEDVPWSERTRSWGSFRADDVALETIAKNRKAASRLVDEVDFNR